MDTMTNIRTFYAETVWPQIADDLKADFSARYPGVRLTPEAGFTPLPDVPVCMVVGLTGTGKSTTLAQLAEMRGTGHLHYCDDIPDRRELADLIIIPTAQAVGGEAIRPIKDREQRFELTRRFAQNVDSGGSAAAYGWLHYRWDKHTPLLSDGLRGPDEIAYALRHYPRWKVCELWVDPVTRLRRLSHREDRFDFLANSSAVADLRFLPENRRLEVMHLLESGEITAKAVITARAESQNYGGAAYDPNNRTPHYRCLQIDNMTPADVAQAVADFMQEGI
jgi:hypothetical protein